MSLEKLLLLFNKPENRKFSGLCLLIVIFPFYFFVRFRWEMNHVKFI
nr:MAG TPA: hypothetical protein [Myoviridae sp. ctfuG5]